MAPVNLQRLRLQRLLQLILAIVPPTLLILVVEGG